jgi:S-adenosyl-L-methionine methyltransferase
MSRLDSFIRRLEAQRACLNLAAAAIRDLPGPVLELGLGNGRTYDHLRECLPEREIFVFEREVAAHPACIPDPAHLILGDLRATLAAARGRLPGPAALVHSDVGTGDPEGNRALAAWLARCLPPLLAEGAWVVADQPILAPDLIPLAPPQGVAQERYVLYLYAESARNL